MVKANIGLVRRQFIMITPNDNVTDSNEQTKFMITAKDKTGISKITLRTGNVRKSVIVNVIKLVLRKS
ncbi:MAG: hypothetical protein B6D34_12885 [Candidatus Brocadia sp. UTAMX1]|jgi:hypothetical protein|nr:MAG: hypothetical protein B6D34_12885 [Candidatus Brocadia sp. UTAMX1]